ncbi:MAG: hypothetical protein ACYSU6_00535, partial [Planctomycetota bacterium]
MKLIKRAISACLRVLGQMKWWAKLALVMVAACFFAGSAIVVTGQPGFCDSCHIMNSYYASWQDSKH